MSWTEEDLTELLAQGKVRLNKSNNGVQYPRVIAKQPISPPKTNKYSNKKTVVDGIKFDSKKESAYYQELLLKQRSGEIQSFELQVPFVLQEGFVYQGKKERAIKYICDFRVVYPDKHIEVVDVKGYKTKEYKLKRKLLLCQLSKDKNIIFKEV